MQEDEEGIKYTCALTYFVSIGLKHSDLSRYRELSDQVRYDYAK